MQTLDISFKRVFDFFLLKSSNSKNSLANVLKQEFAGLIPCVFKILYIQL